MDFRNKIVIFSGISLVIFLFSFFAAGSVFAQNVNEIHFFYSPPCPYCAAQQKFLNELENKYPQIEIKRYEFSKNTELIREFYKNYGVPPQQQGFVPVTFTRNNYFVGFNDKIAEQIESCIQECLGGGPTPPSLPDRIKIPILGYIDANNLSLPALASVLGFFDGFNICSLGALVLILGLVIALRSRKKILLFGGAFILVSVIVYWSLVFLWHRIFIFFAPLAQNMEMLIGLLAALGGWYFLKEFLNSKKRGAVCKFGGFSDRMAGKISEIFEKKSGILVMLAAVSLFASAVTIIEFPCTAFFPVIFTGIMAQMEVPFSLSLLYISIYVFFYMLDEFIVLFLAVFTMRIWIASPKFVTWLSLFASIIMFLFGFYYLLWPTLRVWFNF